MKWVTPSWTYSNSEKQLYIIDNIIKCKIFVYSFFPASSHIKELIGISQFFLVNVVFLYILYICSTVFSIRNIRNAYVLEELLVHVNGGS